MQPREPSRLWMWLTLGLMALGTLAYEAAAVLTEYAVTLAAGL
jgi:hypothetical protein